jgi:methionyl-tRNA formyltransferase
MRVIFFGTAEFAVPSLERLARSTHEVALCVTQPDRPQGRGLKREPSPVKRTAERLGIPLAQPERLDARMCEGRAAEVGVVAAYGQLVKRDVLEAFPQGMLGVHPSLLPKYRGAAPVAWALLNGETRTGLTIFRMNERLDAGEILLQEPAVVEPEEDAAGLTARLASLGAETLVRALDALAEGGARPVPQDEAQATYAPKLTKAQGRIDWTQPAEAIARLVRATNPWPGAVSAFRGESLRIWRAAVGGAPRAGQVPGTVVDVEPDRLIIAAGGGTLVITELQPAGRRRLSAREFLAGHRVKIGDRFETEDMRQET